jgi:hypothetical protein
MIKKFKVTTGKIGEYGDPVQILKLGDIDRYFHLYGFNAMGGAPYDQFILKVIFTNLNGDDYIECVFNKGSFHDIDYFGLPAMKVECKIYKPSTPVWIQMINLTGENSEMEGMLYFSTFSLMYDYDARLLYAGHDEIKMKEIE